MEVWRLRGSTCEGSGLNPDPLAPSSSTHCLPLCSFLIQFEMTPISVFFKLWSKDCLYQSPWMLIKTTQIARPCSGLLTQISGSATGIGLPNRLVAILALFQFETICPGDWGEGKCCLIATGHMLEVSVFASAPCHQGHVNPNCQLRSLGSLGQPVGPKAMAGNGLFKPKSLILAHARELQLSSETTFPACSLLRV